MENPNPVRILVVLNPAGGSCDAAAVRQKLEQACAEAGLGCDLYQTSGEEGDLPAIVRQAQKRNYKTIVAAGGDGTASMVANALLESGTPLAILPVGTANLLARELNIPLDLDTACQLIAKEERTRHIDVMRAGTTIFLSHISLGVYSLIAEKTSAAAKRYFRQLAYLWNMLPELIGKRTWRFDLDIDGQRHRVQASFIMVANVGGIGAATLRWGPGIRPDDGEINVCIVRAHTLKEYLLFAWYVLRRRHKDFSMNTYLRARRHIRIRANKQLPIRGDGEIVGHSEIDIEILPQALAIRVPDEEVESRV
jgi:diacylglycerol kinase (ATP)